MQADIIGVGPLPIVILTSFFLGGVLAVDARSHPCAASWRRTYCRMPPCSK
jgi:hypothetical protein